MAATADPGYAAPVADEGSAAKVPPTAAVDSAGSADSEAAPAANTQDDKDVEQCSSMEVPESIVGWLVGPGAEHVIELERLSSARIEVSRNSASEGKREVFLRGASVAVARARVLLEEKLRTAPTAGDGSCSAREEKAPASGGELNSPAEEDARPMVMVAGRSFKDRDQLVSHIRALQASVTDGAMLGPEDAFFIFHLITYHPNFVEKMTAPVTGFKYGPHESFAGSKCFFVVRVDGSEEGISIMKCVDSLAPKKPRSETRIDGEVRGTKRAREEDPAGEDSSAPPAKSKREIQSGCVLVIDGVPANFDYDELRELLNEYGSVRFLELLRPKQADETDADETAPDADEAAPDADEAMEGRGKDKTPEAAESTSGGVQGAAQGETTTASSTREGPAKAASEGEACRDGSAEQQVSANTNDVTACSGGTATGAATGAAAGAAAGVAADSASDPREGHDGTAEPIPKAESRVDAASQQSEDAEGTKPEAKEQPRKGPSAPARARARYSDAEGPARAASELRELGGTPVTLRVLEGEEEREFWERLWQKADAAKQGKGGKSKGKDGKGKGKGKGKSKGGGKGKGKKGKAW